MKRIFTYVACLIVVLLLVTGGVLAAPSTPQVEPPRMQPSTPTPDPLAPMLFQIGAHANADGAAVSFLVDGYNVRMFYVLPDGQFYPNEGQPVNGDVIQATVTVCDKKATVFALMSNGDVAMLRFDLPDVFPCGEQAVPSVLYLPLVAH